MEHSLSYATDEQGRVAEIEASQTIQNSVPGALTTLTMSVKASKTSSSTSEKSSSGALLVLGFWLLVSIGYITFYAFHFKFSPKVIVLHLMLVAGCFAGLLFLLSTLMRIRAIEAWVFGRLVWASTWGLLIFCLSLIYILNVVSLSEWGQNITWNIVFKYGSQLPALIKHQPFYRLPIYVAILALPLFCFLGFWMTARSFQTLYIRIGAAIYDRVQFRSTYLVMLATGLFLLAQLWPQQQSIRSQMSFKKEPIYNFFKPFNSMFKENGTFDPAVIQAHQEAIAYYPEDQDYEKKSVVLITVDALRPDHMSAYGYHRKTTPYLDSLLNAGQLQLSSQFYSNCSNSYGGILSVLNCTPIHQIANANFNIQDVFNKLGYYTCFVLGGSHSDWYQMHRFYENNSKLDFYRDGFHSKNFHAKDDNIVLEFLDQIPDADEAPGFFYIHLMAAHPGGVKLPEYARYQPAGSTGYVNRDQRRWINYYDNGVLQADDYIKKIMVLLTRKGYCEDCLLLISADHGEALGEKGRYGHGQYLGFESVNIPLLIHDTNAAADSPLLAYGTQIDIGPTILHRLGILKPEVWAGRSVETVSEGVSYRYQRQRKSYGLIREDSTGIYRYLYNTASKQQELYKIDEDPKELQDLSAEPRWKALLKELHQNCITTFRLDIES